MIYFGIFKYQSSTLSRMTQTKRSTSASLQLKSNSAEALSYSRCISDRITYSPGVNMKLNSVRWMSLPSIVTAVQPGQCSKKHADVKKQPKVLLSEMILTDMAAP